MKLLQTSWILILALAHITTARVIDFRFSQSTLDSTISPPIAAAWMYLSDTSNYNTIPSNWSAINFKVVDVLYLAPVGVQANGKFQLYNSTSTGPLAHRWQWVMQRARAQNPNIKIIASQWWGYGGGLWGLALNSINGSDPSAVSTYTTSVAAFMQRWSTVAGGLNGVISTILSRYDIDYETNNTVPAVPTILSQIRSKLNALSGTYYITVSPASTQYLGKALASIDYVNMQNYAGGSYLTAADYVKLGFKYDQLLYGYCAESDCGGPSLSYVESQYTSYKNKNETLAGIHTYRLNSNNFQFEDSQAAKVYQFLHDS